MKNTKKYTCFILAMLLIVMAVLPIFASSEGNGENATLIAPNPNASSEAETSSDGSIKTIKDLDGKKIGVQTGVLYEDLIQDEIQGEEWLYYKMPNDMIPALQTGKIDAYLIEEVGYYAQRYAHPELRVMDEKAGYCDFAVIVGNNAKQETLFAQMQEFIKNGKESGWLDELYDYWVKNWDPNICHIENVPETTGENGTVIIAIEGGYEPFSFESNGEYSGYDVEFMMNFCAAYGYNWDFQAMEFDSIAVGAIAGKYDFGMNIVVDEERAENSVLTDPYYRCDIVFVLPGEGGSSSGDISTIADLDGKKIGVQTGVLYEDLIKDEIQGEEWFYYKMPNDMIPALQTGKIDAYLIEEVGYYAQRYAHPELRVMAEKAGYCDFAVIVGNNAKQETLFAQMQEFIKNGKESGWLDELYDYWVKNWDPNICHIENVPETTGENGTVIIAIEGGYEPFSFESNGEYSGYDVEFMMNFCAAYGYNWDFQAMEFDSIAVGAIAGKYDFGMNIVVDEERAENSVLTDPYYRCDIVFVLPGETETEDLGFFGRIAKSFTNTFIKEQRWKLFVEGALRTMLITLVSVFFGTVIGFAIYMACRHGNKVANGITNVFNFFIEGVPTVVFLMLLAYAVFKNTKLNATWVSIIGFSLIFGCQMYDMLCVGCNAIPRGQTEASRALGYSDSQCFFKIILPQAARHFMPIYNNDVIALLKETSIVGYIAVRDLTKAADLVRSRTYEVFFALIIIIILYFILEAMLTFVIKKIQLKFEPEHRTKEEILKGIVETE